MYKRSWASLYMIALFFIVPIITFQFFLIYNPHIWRELAMKYSNLTSNICYGLSLMAMILFFLLYVAAIFKTVALMDQGKAPKLFESCKEAARDIKPFCAVCILYVLLVSLWTLVIVIPGIIFGVLYSLAPMAMLIDQKRGFEALIFSKRIVKQTCVKYLDYLLLTTLLLFAFFVPIVIFMDMLINFMLSRGMYSGAIIVDYSEILVLLFVVNYFMMFCYFLYQEMKIRGGVNA